MERISLCLEPSHPIPHSLSVLYESSGVSATMHLMCFRSHKLQALYVESKLLGYSCPGNTCLRNDPCLRNVFLAVSLEMDELFHLTSFLLLSHLQKQSEGKH